MTLINFKHRYDCGHDWYVQILNTGRHLPRPVKNKSLLQASVSWNDWPSWPFVQIKSGNGSVLSIMFWAYKFGFDIGFIEHTWNWEYLEKMDEQETELG